MHAVQPGKQLRSARVLNEHTCLPLRQAQPKTATGYEVILLLAIPCQPETHNNGNINNGNIMKWDNGNDHDSDSANDTPMYACRPDYKKLGVLKQQFPDVPIMALTATATQRVCDDLKAMLRIEACETFSASVNRPNLIYEGCHQF